MAAAVISTAASLRVLSKCFLSSASHLPRILTRRRPTILLSHSLAPASPRWSRFTPIRCYKKSSVASYWELLGSNFGLRDPPGLDEESWGVVMDKPGGEEATQQQMLDCCVQTLAKVVGSYEEEAKKKIYRVLCGKNLRFGFVIDEETSNRLKGLPGVQLVHPDMTTPSYNNHADQLKHCALNVKRFIGFIQNQGKGESEDEGEYGDGDGDEDYAIVWRKKMIEKAIEGLPVGFHALDLSYKDREDLLLCEMGHVLNDLSVHVKQLWNINAKGAGDNNFNSPIPTNTERSKGMKKVKKATESLLLAVEAVGLFADTDQNVITRMEPVVSGNLSETMMELFELWEDCPSAHRTYYIKVLFPYRTLRSDS